MPPCSSPPQPPRSSPPQKPSPVSVGCLFSRPTSNISGSQPKRFQAAVQLECSAAPSSTWPAGREAGQGRAECRAHAGGLAQAGKQAGRSGVHSKCSTPLLLRLPLPPACLPVPAGRARRRPGSRRKGAARTPPACPHPPACSSRHSRHSADPDRFSEDGKPWYSRYTTHTRRSGHALPLFTHHPPIHTGQAHQTLPFHCGSSCPPPPSPTTHPHTQAGMLTRRCHSTAGPAAGASWPRHTPA